VLPYGEVKLDMTARLSIRTTTPVGSSGAPRFRKDIPFRHKIASSMVGWAMGRGQFDVQLSGWTPSMSVNPYTRASCAAVTDCWFHRTRP